MTIDPISPAAPATDMPDSRADLWRLLPADWQLDLTGWQRDRVHIGATAAQVFRLSRADGATDFLKLATGPSAMELQAEIKRLAWLGDRGARVPRLLGHCATGDLVALRTAAVRGRHPTDLDWPPERIVAAIAEALASLHHLTSPADCPFDGTAAARLRQARWNLQAGLVDPADFDGANAGTTPEDLLRDLAARLPPEEDLVITHGDLYLSNILIDAEDGVHFIDCGRVARADRYMDLAIIAEEISEVYGAMLLPHFCRHYGIATLDPAKRRHYKQLDEFF